MQTFSFVIRSSFQRQNSLYTALILRQICQIRQHGFVGRVTNSRFTNGCWGPPKKRWGNPPRTHLFLWSAVRNTPSILPKQCLRLLSSVLHQVWTVVTGANFVAYKSRYTGKHFSRVVCVHMKRLRKGKRKV